MVAMDSQRASVKSFSGMNGDLLQLVSFRLDNDEYALEILKVQEIIRKQELTRVPNSPAFVEGVINLRGKVIPVISLRRRFGLPVREQDKNTRIVVSEVGDMVMAFEVDSVSEVLRIRRDTVEPPPRLGKVEREFILGVGKLDNRLLILLDLDRLLSPAETTAALERETTDIEQPAQESAPLSV
jgi:purine-binding chemotaxis protein CheW